MDLKTYISKGERGRASALAAALDISPSYLSQLAKAKKISPQRCVEIEIATVGEVTRQDLRPDDWRVIWPELIPMPNDRRRRGSHA